MGDEVYSDMVYCCYCKYFEEINDKLGHCHCYPPISGYVRVNNLWWCRKGIPRDNEQ